MIIAKKPEKRSLFRRNYYYFNKARDAFRFSLEYFDICKKGILLPSYIGWSPKEGSGVFDPIKQLGCKHQFYRLNKKLEIDVEDLIEKANKEKPAAILIINYFGFVDPNVKLIYEFCKEKKILLIEDQAHSMLTDLVGWVSGNYSTISFYSLHKILPIREGGILVVNSAEELGLRLGKNKMYLGFFRYNLSQIAKKRVANWRIISRYLRKRNEPKIVPLHNMLYKGIVPHSFPVLIECFSRDELYFELNNRGYGVTSLYHTLIEELKEKNYPDSYYISKRILNLPVHQETNNEEINEMISVLVNIINCKNGSFK